jgi:hypothetical protein
MSIISSFEESDRVSGRRGRKCGARRTLTSRYDQHSQQAGRRPTSSSVVEASLLQHITMLTINGSNAGDDVWVEGRGVCAGE